MTVIDRCPSCGAGGMRAFYEVTNVPVHSCIMVNSEQEALDFPRGDIVMGVCDSCGFVCNLAFDPSVQDYTPGYEDQQSFSPTFNSFAGRLAGRLIDKYDVRGKQVVEVGCGKGDFLALMCEMGNNSGVGIDPTCIKERMQTAAIDRITIVQDYYSDKYTDYRGDMVMCRHTLEHIHNTQEFVTTVRGAIGNNLNTTVFFEIPDAVIVLKDLVFWDIYYEHCSLFTPGSLARLFRSCNFEVLDLYREYDDQYLMIDAVPVAAQSKTVHPLEESVNDTLRDVEHFAVNAPAKIDDWRDRIAECHLRGKAPVIWGSGSKCVAFMTTLGVRDEIGCVIDINPHRHGKYIPGAAKQVQAPDYLQTYKPDTIIVMNPVYKNEITDMVRGMGLDSEVITV